MSSMSLMGFFTQMRKITSVDMIGVGLALIVSLCVFSFNLFIVGPMVQADEGCYLANAAAIAGFLNDFASSYNAGYSLMLAPAFWIGDTPHSIWIAVKAINAALFFLIVVSLWLSSNILAPELSLARRIGAVLLVSVYPMWVVMVGYSFAQIAFVPCYLLTFLTFTKTIRGGALFWLLLGLLAGFLYWIHPTGIAVIVALMVACGFVAVKRFAFFHYLVFTLTVIVVVLSYKYDFVPWLFARMTISGQPPKLHYPSVTDMLSPLLTLMGIKNIVARLGGHVFYLSIGSVGLIWVGLIELWSNKKNGFLKNKENQAGVELSDQGVALFLTLSLLGSVALSVLLFSSTPSARRLDHWMYGRYVEGVIAPLLLIGALSPSLRKGLWAIPAAIISVVILSMGLEDYAGAGCQNITALWQDFVFHQYGIWVWLVSGCVVILFAALPRYWVGVSVIGLVFCFASYWQIQWHVTGSRNSFKRIEAVSHQVRKKFLPGTCLGFDHSGVDSYKKHVFWFDFGFIFYDYALQRMTFDTWMSKCDGPLLSYEKKLDEDVVGIYPSAFSSQNGPVMWEKGEPPFIERYPMSIENNMVSLLQTLGAGWHDLERSHVWSSQTGHLKLPVPEDCRGDNNCVAVLHLSAYGASPDRKVELFINGEDGNRASETVVISDVKPIQVRIPLRTTMSIYKIRLSIPDAKSPRDLELQGSDDVRILGVALREISLDNERIVQPEVAKP